MPYYFFLKLLVGIYFPAILIAHFSQSVEVATNSYLTTKHQACSNIDCRKKLAQIVIFHFINFLKGSLYFSFVSISSVKITQRKKLQASFVRPCVRNS